MLEWRQVGSWDPETLTLNFRVIPAFFTRFVDIRGRKRYVQESDCVTMEISARISMNIPGIGRLMERVVIGEINKEQIKVFRKIEQEIKERAES